MTAAMCTSYLDALKPFDREGEGQDGDGGGGSVEQGEHKEDGDAVERGDEGDEDVEQLFERPPDKVGDEEDNRDGLVQGCHVDFGVVVGVEDRLPVCR